MDGMQWMAGAMRAARAQLETAAHNLANAESTGYRRLVTELRLEPGGVAVRTRPTGQQGGLRTTGRAFDLALIGPGAFRVGTGTTRDGTFVRGADGVVRSANGLPLRGSHGPLRVPAGAAFAPDGSVRAGGRVIDRLPLPAGTTLRSGALESSNADTIGETLLILTAQRAFETAQKTLVAIDETRQKAVDDVGRLK